MLGLYFVLLIIIGFPSFFLYGALLHLKTSHPYVLSRSDWQNVLWVIAHPDDESLFFAPSILNFNPEEGNKHLLSLSIGNDEGLGTMRAKELTRSCQILGIDSQFCAGLDHPKLQDSMSLDWSSVDVVEQVEAYIDAWQIDTVVTFDASGISLHPNHIALYEALSRHSGISTEVCHLQSTNKLAKFSSFFSLPVTLLSHFIHNSNPRRSSESHLFLNSPTQVAQSISSFRAHVTQQRWFRNAYVYTSRYMWYDQILCTKASSRDQSQVFRDIDEL